MLSSETGKEVIKKELPLMPKLPGVYRMLNSKNEILRQKNNKLIFTGAQIINRSVFKKKKIKQTN